MSLSMAYDVAKLNNGRFVLQHTGDRFPDTFDDAAMITYDEVQMFFPQFDENSPPDEEFITPLEIDDITKEICVYAVGRKIEDEQAHISDTQKYSKRGTGLQDQMRERERYLMRVTHKWPFCRVNQRNCEIEWWPGAGNSLVPYFVCKECK